MIKDVLQQSFEVGLCVIEGEKIDIVMNSLFKALHLDIHWQIIFQHV